MRQIYNDRTETQLQLPSATSDNRSNVNNTTQKLWQRKKALETNLKNLKGQMEAFSGFGKNRSLLDSFNDVISFLKLGPDPAAVSVFQSRPPHEKEENIMNQSLYVGQSVFRPLSEPQHASSSQMHPELVSLLQDPKALALRSELNSFHSTLSTRYYQLEYEQKEMEKKIAKSYDGLEKNKYSLFSVIVHEGTPESGHYYCFVRLDGDNWVKFNDYQTKRVSQNEVLEIAKGGEKTNSSAYCAFYMREEDYIKSPPHNYEFLESITPSQIRHQFAQPSISQISSRGYGKFLTETQRRAILEKNRLFDYVS